MRPIRSLPAIAGVLLLGLAGTADAAAPPKLTSVTLAIRNRVFHQFAEQQTLRLGKEFVIGDTDFAARIVQYVPDFAMDLSTGKVISRTSEPRNPAFKIIVRQKGVPQDTTWAMMSLPPHFTRRSFLAFKVMRIDFEGRPPMVADSVAAVKELEALKEAARRAAPTDGSDISPHGSFSASPHSSTIPLTPAHGSGGGKPDGKATK